MAEASTTEAPDPDATRGSKIPRPEPEHRLPSRQLSDRPAGFAERPGPGVHQRQLRPGQPGKHRRLSRSCRPSGFQAQVSSLEV